MPARSDPDLTTVELLVLYEAGGDNTLANAYGCVQLYSVFERKEELLAATRSALLRLFDLGLVRFVEASDDVGYTAKRFELPAMTREELVAALNQDRDEDDEAARQRETYVWFDPTPEGEAVLDATPRERIPRVSGRVSRPWLE